ncbi:MAG: TrkH family potassium uptake protein [Sporichthyaceae bacterium]|nr:TrkH family potassium uptake protein [Sporichthyaceae bacterium]
MAHRRSWWLSSPARVVAGLFVAGIAAATLVLVLPISGAGGESVGFRTALFTATSAICVTGLSINDVATDWSTFGEVAIMVAVQLGGFGIIALTSLLAILVSRRIGLSTRLIAQTETNTLDLGDVRRVLIGVGVVTVLIEGAVAIVLTLRWWLSYGESLGYSAYLGVFHSIMSFNNAGFSLYSDSLTGFATDPLILFPVVVGIILGGLGFPVLFELRREVRAPKRWSVHLKIMLLGTVVLVVGGMCALTISEWSNPRTIGDLDVGAKLLNGLFASVTPRTAGFNTFDYGQANDTTRLITDALMFIGAGPASTSGGIKVTTFVLLFFAILSEARGDQDVDAFGRRVPTAAIRQAISVALLGVAVVAIGTLVMLAITDLGLDVALFEVTSAFATVGLSTGVLPDLSGAAHYFLAGLMFVGRLGTVTLASALALRESRRLYRLPEERPIVG